MAIRSIIREYRDEIMALPQIGPVYSLNMEAILEQEPGFVIAQVGTQSTQAASLRELGFDVITTYIRSFEDVISAYETFGKILCQEELAAQRVVELENQRKAIISKSPQDGKKVVILYLTGNALSVKLDNSIAGDVALSLGLHNIASNLPPDTIGSENTPLDIEYIVEQNPDIVLVTSMISSNQAAIETMEEIFSTNPAWKGVRAVTEGNVVYLPQEYFLYNAGPYYCEAIEYMARGVYSEIYGQLSDWYEALSE